MGVVSFMLEKQRKLTSAIFGSVLLIGGALCIGDAAKYSAFSLACAGLWGGLIAGHAWQARNEKPPERSDAAGSNG